MGGVASEVCGQGSVIRNYVQEGVDVHFVHMDTHEWYQACQDYE